LASFQLRHGVLTFTSALVSKKRWQSILSPPNSPKITLHLLTINKMHANSSHASIKCMDHVSHGTRYTGFTDFTARCHASAVYVVTVCPSVCHKSVFYWNTWLHVGSCKERHAMDFSFLMTNILPKILAKFKWGHPQRRHLVQVG